MFLFCYLVQVAIPQCGNTLNCPVFILFEYFYIYSLCNVPFQNVTSFQNMSKSLSKIADVHFIKIIIINTDAISIILSFSCVFLACLPLKGRGGEWLICSLHAFVQRWDRLSKLNNCFWKRRQCFCLIDSLCQCESCCYVYPIQNRPKISHRQSEYLKFLL